MTSTNSVYHRATLLSPVFPWILFSNHLIGKRLQPPILQFAHAATVQNYCGTDWGDANGKCTVPCPDGESTVCPWGEQCFADLSSCPSLTVGDVPLPAPLPAPYNNPSLSVPGGGDDHPFVSTASNSCDPSTTNIVNVGYYQSWAKYRDASCFPQLAADIPVAQFGYTHLVYSFAEINLAGELGPYGGITDEFSLYQQFNSLKGSNPGLKTLIAVGGWNFDQKRFTHAASTPETRARFAESVVNFLVEHNFDGLDLDWEYPVSREGQSDPIDYANYPLLVEAVRSAFTDYGNGDFLLTMAVPVNPEKLEDGYDLPYLGMNLDWFNLMAYDIYGAWSDVAGSNTDLSYISMTVDYMLSKGVPPSQMALGLASYGRSMILTDPSCKTAGCPISGGGLTGCSGELGFSPYFELKEKYVDSGNYDSLLINDQTGSMEMVVNGNIFVSFDVPQSFLTKYDYYMSKCFRGQMWWAVDMIKEPVNFNGHRASAPIPSPLNTPSSRPPPAAVPNPAANLNAPGVNKDDAMCNGKSGLVGIEDCLGFVFCSNGRMSGSVTMCSPGLIFDAHNGICNWPSETNLCGFEFCPNGLSGFVPFEECTKFYYCKSGTIDGDIDVCPDGTLFDEVLGICNWKSMVECNTKAPTQPPVEAPRIFESVNVGAGATAPLPAAPVAMYPPTGTSPLVNTVYPPTGNAEYLPTGIPPPPPTPNIEIATPNTTPASTPLPTESQGQSNVLRFDPTDDAYVQESQPFKNFNDNYIVVDQNLRFDGLLRFSIHGIKDRPVRYVKLRLFVSNKSSSGGKFFACMHNWHEDVVSWDTVPSVLYSEPLAVLNGVPEEDWIEVDVTGLVSKDGPVALRIMSESSDNVMYSSKENPNRNSPQLIVGIQADAIDSRTSTALDALKIGPTDDTFVFMTAANKNFGDRPDLKVDLDNGFKTSYLRFDFSRVNIAAIEKAVLRLYATDSSPSGGTIVKTTQTDWDEGTMTWNNAPAADGQVIVTLGEVIQDNWYEIDITGFITESGPLSLCILGSHDDRAMYSSKEGEQSPEISLHLIEVLPEVQMKIMELIPTDDATIVLQQGNTNFGVKDSLEIEAKDGMKNILIRFDASEIPQGEVKSATLRMYASNDIPAYGGTFVEVLNTNWNEQTVTWNNAPEGDGQILGSIMEIEAGSWFDIDVTTAVVGGAPFSLRVSSPHSSIGVYGSKESRHKPRLIVHYDEPEPIPEDVQILTPTDDASILLDKGDANFGRDSQLKIDGHSGVYNSLLRFDLTPIEQGTVIQAILRLYAIDGSPSGGTFIGTSQTDWSQYTVTWDTAPVADGIVVDTLGEVIPYKWYDIDVTELARGGEPISIRIAPSHGNRCAYSSNEDPYGRGPQLLITADLFKGME